MKIKLNLKTALIAAGIFVGALLLLTLWVYAAGSNDPFTQSLKKIYPAALVGHGMISIHDWEQNLAIAKKLNGDVNKARDQFIRVKQQDILAQKLRMRIAEEDYKSELDYYVTGQETEYNKFLQDIFNGDEKLFIQYAIKPQALDAHLRIKYNNDLNANQDAHTRAQNILAKITQGAKFEDVAKTDSDDKATGQIGGDLGFAEIEEFIPEVRPAILNSKVGEVKPVVVISRFGYHIIYPVETAEKDGKKLWHIKHILVATSGYDQWLNSQLTRVSVWRIR